MKDDDIMAALRSGRREKALVQLYDYLPKVTAHIRKLNGTRTDAQDVFQEALIILIQKAESPDFRLTSSIHTYLFGTCHFLWKNELRKRGKLPTADLAPQQDPAATELNNYLERETKIRQAETALRQLGKRCQELLVLFYYRALSMKAIAQQMGFTSENVAKNQKYKCLEQAKLKLKEQLNTIG